MAALIPLLLGFALRLRYALGAEPFVDEPTTLLVAQAIARSGLPTLPSGLFYGNDLPFSYLVGGLVALFGPHLLVLRLLSVAASTATIGLVYLVGRRLGSAWVGLWAGLLLAVDPLAIIWGGRARAYALLALLVFLAAWLFYAGTASPGRDMLRRLALALLVVATFVHPEAALLLPALVVGGGLLRGWRWWLHRGRLAELALAAAGLGARYWLQTLLARGQVGSFQTITGSRPPLELGADWLARLEGLAPFFLAPHRLPWTLLALLALGSAIWVMRAPGRWHQRRHLAGSPNEDPAGPPQAKGPAILPPALCIFLSACLWLVPLVMVLLLGSTYQSPRYLTMLLPIFAFLAAWGLDWALHGLAGLARSSRWRQPLAVLATLVLVVAYLPGAVAASGLREKGFQSALEYVARHWQSGDRLATVAPAYSQLILGHCDYFTLGLDYEEFVYRAGDGQLLDRWLGSPLIRSAEELHAVLDEPGRLWLVTDESRLRQRFDPAFAQTVWRRMELVDKTDGVMVFVTSSVPEPSVSQPVDAIFGGQVALTGYDLGRLADRPPDLSLGQVVAWPGQSLPLTLYWKAIAPSAAQYTAFVHLLGSDGERHAGADGPPLGGLQPMAHWLVGETLADRRMLALPPDLAPGHYQVVLGLYTPDGGDRLAARDAAGHDLGQALTLDYVRVPAAGQVLPSPEQTVGALFTGGGDEIWLLGYTLPGATAQPGGKLSLTLHWQAQAPVGADYTVFVHLLDARDQIRGQGDGPPVGGFYLTSFWDLGEVVLDERLVSIHDDSPAGSYRLVLGLYLLPTGQRLSTAGSDRLPLAEIEVEP
jgi:4-amino-4-deoxy-L-arabinose transferase-like glycosyltransferase